MVVTKVEVKCDKNDLTGYAEFDAVVYRPPKTSSCQLYFPGDEFQKLDWEDLPPRARPRHDAD
ncbi:hypothetical protein WL29_22520 [Burkholderia ubonensis]|uniref:Uncharacterized protein n=2 Tax=Burkholderia ubonensis TaxID=101571 RepID=A0A106QC66_9BURK|nr:hypothetical protein WL29_22520 [Burkholderia ubonensis]